MDCQKIGENINTYIKAKKLTQKQLADLIDKAESSVQKYEKGETEAPISVLEKISTALDVPLQYLLDWTNQESLNSILTGIKCMNCLVPHRNSHFANAIPALPLYHDNIICLPRQLGGQLHPFRRSCERGGTMSTYEEFIIIITVAGLIVSILNMKNKK